LQQSGSCKCNLFSNENGEVAVLLVDARAECDETHEEDADGKAPHDQLPVAKVIDKATCILQQLQRPQHLSSTFTKHHQKGNSAFHPSGVDKCVVGLFTGRVLRWHHLVNAYGVISLVRLIAAA